MVLIMWQDNHVKLMYASSSPTIVGLDDLSWFRHPIRPMLGENVPWMQA